MHSIWIDPQGIWVTAHPQGPGVISGSRPWFGYGNSRIEDEVCGPWWLGIVTGGVRIPNPILDAALAHLRHSRITRFTWNDPGNPIVSRGTTLGTRLFPVKHPSYRRSGVTHWVDGAAVMRSARSGFSRSRGPAIRAGSGSGIPTR